MYKKIVIGIVLMGMFSLLLGACAIVDTSNTNTVPTVHMGGATFLQSSITISKGDMLTLVDDVTAKHIVVNGSWANSTPTPSSQAGAPVVNHTFVGNDSAEIGPFNIAGTFHYFCTIHTGMNLKVVVQ
jgi:plastocyanin